MIAKDQMHLSLMILEMVNGVELFGGIRSEAAATVARKGKTNASAQDLFIGGHPFHTQILRYGQRFLRNAAFRRPNALRADLEYLLVQIESTEKLLASIFGMTKAVLRQRQSRSRNRAHIRIAD